MSSRDRELGVHGRASAAFPLCVGVSAFCIVASCIPVAHARPRRRCAPAHHDLAGRKLGAQWITERPLRRWGASIAEGTRHFSLATLGVAMTAVYSTPLSLGKNNPCACDCNAMRLAAPSCSIRCSSSLQRAQCSRGSGSVASDRSFCSAIRGPSFRGCAARAPLSEKLSLV